MDENPKMVYLLSG